MSDEHELPDEWDPLKLFRELAEKKESGDAQFARICKKLLSLQTGRDFMRELMARHNFMGSVFTERMDSHEAARNDGKRELISDILNSSISKR